jgi:hypothetical protein
MLDFYSHPRQSVFLLTRSCIEPDISAFYQIYQRSFHSDTGDNLLAMAS